MGRMRSSIRPYYLNFPILISIMKIRRAKDSDYEELMVLYNNFVGEDRYSGHDGDSFKEVLKSPNNYIFIVEEGGKIIGFATALIRTLIRYPKPVAELDELFVVEEFRKHGIGKQLIEKIEEIAKKRNCYRIYIASANRFETAHKFYEGIGYIKYGFHFYKNLSMKGKVGI